MCVFFGDFNVATPQRRSSHHTHTHAQTLSHTHTHTHTHDWPTVASRSSGSCGDFRVLQNFWTTCGQQDFFRPTGGHATYKNIILRELIVSFVYVSIFTQALCCKVYD